MDQQNVQTLSILMCGLVACWVVMMIVATRRREQRYKAARRIRDRLLQEENPERWAWLQARQAREAALITEELAAMRRASWYGRLRRRWRQTDEAQG